MATNPKARKVEARRPPGKRERAGPETIEVGPLPRLGGREIPRDAIRITAIGRHLGLSSRSDMSALARFIAYWRAFIRDASMPNAERLTLLRDLAEAHRAVRRAIDLLKVQWKGAWRVAETRTFTAMLDAGRRGADVQRELDNCVKVIGEWEAIARRVAEPDRWGLTKTQLRDYAIAELFSFGLALGGQTTDAAVEEFCALIGAPIRDIESVKRSLRRSGFEWGTGRRIKARSEHGRA